MIQCADILFGALHHRHRNAGHIGLYDRALGGVIVHKHKAVGTKAQLGGSFNQIAVFIFPVGLDGHKILGLQRAVGVFQARHGVFHLIFAVHGQQHTDLLVGFQIVLEFLIHLPQAHLGANGNALYAVIAHNTAPKRVVQIQREGLFVAAVQRFDNIRQAFCQIRNGIQTQRIFVHMPVKTILPLGIAVVTGQIIQIVYIKILVVLRILIQLLVQAADKVGAAAIVADILVAQQAVVGALKVVLNNGAAELFAQLFPHHLKMLILGLQHFLHFLLCAGRGGKLGDIAKARVDIDHIGGKCVQLFAAEHGILPILVIFRLIKLGFDAVVQQKHFQLVHHFVGGRAAQHGNFFVQVGRALCAQLALDRAFFAQQVAGVQRVFKAFHKKLLLFYPAVWSGVCCNFCAYCGQKNSFLSKFGSWLACITRKSSAVNTSAPVPFRWWASM